jgi:hypothetical protein
MANSRFYTKGITQVQNIFFSFKKINRGANEINYEFNKILFKGL